jgi:methyl-accepting chemotaxis protein
MNNNKENQHQSHKLRLTIVLLASLPLGVGALIIMIFSSLAQYNSLRSQMESQLVSIATAISSEMTSGDNDTAVTYEDGQLLVDGEDSSYLSESLNEIKSQTGVIMTVYYGQDAIYSSLKDSSSASMSADIWSKVKGGENYNAYNQKIDGTSYSVAYVPIKNNDGSIVGSVFAGIEDSSIKSRAIATFWINLLITVVIVIIIGIIAYFIAKKIADFIEKIKDASASLSEGNLGNGMISNADAEQVERAESRNDELGDLMRNTHEVTEKLRGTVVAIKNQAARVKTSANDLSGIAAQTSNTSESVTNAVGEIAKGATNQAEEVQTSAENVTVITDKMTSIMTNVSDADKQAQDMADISNTASDNFVRLMKAMHDTQAAITDITEKVNNVNLAVNNVNEAVTAINSIASQTNLLSLNASIEAARAGEAGRGFAVVAEEIQKLSTESEQSADSIHEIMATLGKDTSVAIETLDRLNHTVDGQMKQGQETSKSMESLTGSISETRSMFSSVQADAKTVLDLCKSLDDSISNLSAISEENAASTQETSASMEDINNEIENISKLSAELKEVSDALSAELDFFKLD